MSAPGCGDDVFQKFKFASPRFSLHSIFCPITEGQMCCSVGRAEERGSRLPSTDPPTPRLPSYHSISLPCRVVMRKTPLSSSQKNPAPALGTSLSSRPALTQNSHRASPAPWAPAATLIPAPTSSTTQTLLQDQSLGEGGTLNRHSRLEGEKVSRKYLDIYTSGGKATAVVCKAAPAQQWW